MEIKKEYYSLLDVVKFIFAYFVLIIHFQPFAETDFAYASEVNFFLKNYIARVAVPYYLAAAGFLLYKKYEKCNKDKEVIINYIVKIAKMYGLWILILFFGETYQLWYLEALMISAGVVGLMLHKKISLKTMVVISGMLYIIGLLGDGYYGVSLYLCKSLAPNMNILDSSRGASMTLNGLFFGVPFLVIGVVVATNKIKIKNSIAIVGSIVSCLLMLVEVMFMKENGLAVDYNMKIMLIPCTFFLLNLTTNIKTDINHSILRVSGVFVYFLHLFVVSVISKVLSMTGIELPRFVVLILVIVSVTAVSFFLEYISRKERFSFIKHLYS